jgi:phosphoglycerate dehydrogenase-like enzyme
MTGILISERLAAPVKTRMIELAAAAGQSIEWIYLPSDPEARLDNESIEKIEIAFYSADIRVDRGRSFFSAVRKAANIRWLHVFNVGVDHPIFAALLKTGVRITTSNGTTAVPIAQTAITGMLMLARRFPLWLEGQRTRTWKYMRDENQPDDLAGQTLCVLGLGSIGAEIARLGQALGMNVIGIRRTPRKSSDTITDIRAPSALADVLPGCHWLAIACPLTADTRDLINAAMIAKMPKGAHILNVGRGEIIDEAALIAALRDGHLGGAYLDVFHSEPLPQDSPFWALPNVILTPHSSSVSTGNEARVAALFLANYQRYVGKQPLLNEVAQPTTS